MHPDAVCDALVEQSAAGDRWEELDWHKTEKQEESMKIKIDPAIGSLAKAVLDPLTTPDSEDWTLICDRGRVHVTAFRQNKAGVWKLSGIVRESDLKCVIRGLRPGHDLGCVTVIIPVDGKERGALDFLVWVTKQARKKQFSVTSLHGSATTDEAITIAQNYEVALADSEGSA
jgi:hypothetical protein